MSDVISILSQYITELKKEKLDSKGRELLSVMENLLHKEMELESELHNLRSEHERISSKPILVALTKKRNRYMETDTLEELSNFKNLNKLLKLAVELVIRRK